MKQGCKVGRSGEDGGVSSMSSRASKIDKIKIYCVDAWNSQITNNKRNFEKNHKIRICPIKQVKFAIQKYPHINTLKKKSNLIISIN